MQPRLQLQQQLLSWAAGRDDIRAMVQVGSLAREEAGADAHSDLDLILFTTAPEKYTADPSWLSQIGEVWLPVLNQTSRGHAEWLVLFAGGVKGDFLVSAAAGRQTLRDMLLDFPYHNVLRRGLRVLINQTGAAFDSSQLPQAAGEALHPTQEELDAAVNRAILSAARAAKFIYRLDLWRGQSEMSGQLRRQLLTMIEWHARTQSGLHLDTWYDGRHMSVWADPQIVSFVPATFASFDAADMKRALEETIRLIHLLAGEIALALGLQYPNRGQQAAVSWLRSLFAN